MNSLNGANDFRERQLRCGECSWLCMPACSPTNNIITRQTYNQNAGFAASHKGCARTAVRFEDHLLTVPAPQLVTMTGSACYNQVLPVSLLRTERALPAGWPRSCPSFVTEAVISIGPPFRHCLAFFFLLWVASLPSFATQPQAQTAKKPSSSPRQPAAQESQASPFQELQRRVQAQRDAIQSGTPATVESTSRALVAFALRGMAQIRSLEAAWPQAIELYRQSLALEDDTATRLALAWSASRRTVTTTDLIEVNKVLAAEPKNAEAWHTKGKILMAKEDYKGAAEATSRSLELHRDANAQLLLALAYLNLKEKPKAEAVFRQMTQDYGDRAIWHVIIGGAYRETGYQFEAVDEFRKAIAMDNTVPHVHYFLGLTLMEINNNGTTPEIMHEYQEEVRQFPDDFFGNYGLGGLESRDGDVEQSNKHLLAASKADPNNPDPYMYLGLNAFKQHDNATAETYLRKAILLTGDNVSRNDYNIRRGYIALARILSSEGKKEEAQVYFDKAKALSDSQHRANEEAFSSYLNSKEDTGPAVMYSRPAPKPKVPTDQPAQVDFTADIGAVQLENTRLTPAQLEEAEKRVKDLRAILGTGYNDWGTSEAKRGQFGMALSHFQDAEKWDNSTPGVMRNVGLAALKLGNNDEAARAFRVAVEKDPNDTSARAMLAISLYSSHQYAEAAKAFGEVGDCSVSRPAHGVRMGFLAGSNQRSAESHRGAEQAHRATAAERNVDDGR